ncbi:MAG TPA: patatin-like phospholipase family protein [Solirubrobacteraceae bacterium]|nr:patatin-like phospholipase family protein [Solirubrobacteraceae bacterium]
MTTPEPCTAFVLGGGGMLGAAEVGMLAALMEAGIRPDLVVGSSVGAINGAVIAANPTVEQVQTLGVLWRGIASEDTFGGPLLGRLARLARSRTHIHSPVPLRRQLSERLPPTFEELEVPFQCVAASVERAAAHWFDSGALIPAILASCAVPGLLPPVRIDGEHHFDGGLVHSIPLGRAIELGARTVYVLHVGRIEAPLQRPRWPWEVALVAFEISRRHRFVEDMARVPDGVTVHVLPTGREEPLSYTDPSQLRYRDTTRVTGSIERAQRATAAYLRRAGD